MLYPAFTIRCRSYGAAPFRCVASYKYLAPTELLFDRHLAL